MISCACCTETIKLATLKMCLLVQMAETCLPTSKVVLSKIAQLVNDGVRKTDEIQRRIREFVERELFLDRQPPLVSDSRYYPSPRTIRQCVHRTLIQTRYTIDVFTLAFFSKFLQIKCYKYVFVFKLL